MRGAGSAPTLRARAQQDEHARLTSLGRLELRDPLGERGKLDKVPDLWQKATDRARDGQVRSDTIAASTAEKTSARLTWARGAEMTADSVIWVEVGMDIVKEVKGRMRVVRCVWMSGVVGERA
jgi:hypothetical protein